MSEQKLNKNLVKSPKKNALRLSAILPSAPIISLTAKASSLENNLAGKDDTNTEVEDESKLFFLSLVENYSKGNYKKVINSISDKTLLKNENDIKFLHLKIRAVYQLLIKKMSKMNEQKDIKNFKKYIQIFNDLIEIWITFTLRVNPDDKNKENLYELLITFMLQKINILAKFCLMNKLINDALGILSLGQKLIMNVSHFFYSPDTYLESALLFLYMSCIFIGDEDYQTAKEYITRILKLCTLSLELRLAAGNDEYKDIYLSENNLNNSKEVEPIFITEEPIKKISNNKININNNINYNINNNNINNNININNIDTITNNNQNSSESQEGDKDESEDIDNKPKKKKKKFEGKIKFFYNLKTLEKSEKNDFDRLFFIMTVAFYHLGICYEHQDEDYTALQAYKQAKWFGQICCQLEIKKMYKFVEMLFRLEQRSCMRSRLILFFKNNEKKNKILLKEEDLSKIPKKVYSHEEKKDKKFRKLEEFINKLHINEVDDDEPGLFNEINRKPYGEKTGNATKTIHLLNYLMCDKFRNVLDKMEKIELNKISKDTITRISKQINIIKNNQREHLDKLKENKKKQELLLLSSKDNRVIKRQGKSCSPNLFNALNSDKNNTSISMNDIKLAKSQQKYFTILNSPINSKRFMFKKDLIKISRNGSKSNSNTFIKNKFRIKSGINTEGIYIPKLNMKSIQIKAINNNYLEDYYSKEELLNIKNNDYISTSRSNTNIRKSNEEFNAYHRPFTTRDNEDNRDNDKRKLLNKDSHRLIKIIDEFCNLKKTYKVINLNKNDNTHNILFRPKEEINEMNSSEKYNKYKMNTLTTTTQDLNLVSNKSKRKSVLNCLTCKTLGNKKKIKNDKLYFHKSFRLKQRFLEKQYDRELKFQKNVLKIKCFQQTKPTPFNLIETLKNSEYFYNKHLDEEMDKIKELQPIFKNNFQKKQEQMMKLLMDKKKKKEKYLNSKSVNGGTNMPGIINNNIIIKENDNKDHNKTANDGINLNLMEDRESQNQNDTFDKYVNENSLLFENRNCYNKITEGINYLNEKNNQILRKLNKGIKNYQ